jgi:hypothetical protein
VLGSWGRGFQSLRCVTLHCQIPPLVDLLSHQASLRSTFCQTLWGA